MIAVDGDSVAMTSETGVKSEHKWPMLLGRARSEPVECFARAQSTAKACASRAWRIMARRPLWYVLQVGQWSQNHEPVEEFEKHVRAIVERMLLGGVRVCLVTPPTEVTDLAPYLDALHRCSTLYRADIIDVYEFVQREATPEWFEPDSVVRCHFSEFGAANVIKLFQQPDTEHICRR